MPMTEKCYREIQAHSQLAGVSPIEAIILLAVPIVLAPFFTLMDINLLFAFVIDIFVYALLRFSNRLSGFDHGLVSFLSFHFIWPKQLSGFKLDEHDYLRKKTEQEKQVNAA
ncbi:hypothetical protein DWB58_06285 [candidate division KSB1 bacterium]|nr:hypothetical protein [candidate division KSB1 bacterium]